jgi:hypothetical protein
MFHGFSVSNNNDFDELYPMISLLRFSIAFVFSLSISASLQANEEQTLNGFDLTDLSVSAADIFHGGPPRDGIPAIDSPKFIAADNAEFMSADDKILGVVMGDTARAYPVRILTWHEVVNDQIGDQAFAVTYCPLCGSGTAFAAELDGQNLNFGVSGLIFDNNLLLFDRNTESLWTQLSGEAISGELKGQRLSRLPVAHTTWSDWQQRYPETQILSTETGHARDYTDNPYELYEQVGMINFPRRHIDDGQYTAHERVLGIEIDGVSKAYPYEELKRHGEKQFSDSINGKDVVIHWNEKAPAARVTDAAGKALPATYSYWFSWFSFYPQTQIFTSDKESK